MRNALKVYSSDKYLQIDIVKQKSANVVLCCCDNSNYKDLKFFGKCATVSAFSSGCFRYFTTGLRKGREEYLKLHFSP